MIKLGEQEIKELYLGGVKVERAYLGETVVFTADKPSRLPDGYTEVEYISFSKGGSINSGLYPHFSAGRYVFDAEFGAFSVASYVLSSASNTTVSPSKHFGVCLQNTTQIMYKYNYGTGTYANVETTKGRLLIDWDFPNGELRFGGTTISTTPISGTTSKAVCFYVPATGGKMYSAQIYTSGVIKRDFVPCINPSDIVGMYDTVNGKFYTPTQTAAAGPAV